MRVLSFLFLFEDVRAHIFLRGAKPRNFLPLAISTVFNGNI